jgi:hypothetical protein
VFANNFSALAENVSVFAGAKIEAGLNSLKSLKRLTFILQSIPTTTRARRRRRRTTKGKNLRKELLVPFLASTLY